MAISTTNTVWKDAKGQTARLSYFVNAPSAVDKATVDGAVIAAVEPLTNAVLFSIPGAFGGLSHVGELGNTGTYQDCTFKAVMTFVDTEGNIHRYGIPAPKLSIFLADATTVDGSNTDVAAFVTAWLLAYAGPSNVTGRGGFALSNFVGGILQKRKQRRRANIFTLDPDLNQPEE